MKNHALTVRSLARARAMLILGAASLLAVLGAPLPVAAAADLVWVGNDAFNSSDFSNSGNWQSNTLPSWGYGNSLKFNQNQNANVTGLNYNWGNWRDVNDIFWDTTFPVGRTLTSSSGFGINFKIRLENQSSFTQTVTMPLSGGQDGAAEIQLNPVKGSLILSGTIFNDNSKNYTVYGSQDATVTNLTLNTALGPNAPAQANVNFTVAGGRNSAVQVNASQVWAGTTTVNSGAFTTAGGVTLASTAIVVGGGTVATSSANTLADSASLTVNTGRLSIGGSDTVASLAGSGGTVDLAAGATLTFGNASSTSYGGAITGSGNLTKIGSGDLTLTGSSSNSGGTTVSAGRLVVNGRLGGNALVEAAATLGGSGTVAGNMTVAGTHSPGNSPGVQTVGGNLTYDAGSTMLWELTANTTSNSPVVYDQVLVGGNLTFSGSTTLALSFAAVGSTVDWSDAFWDVNRSWKVYDLSTGTTSGLVNLALGGSLLDAQGDALSPTRGSFATALDGQDVILRFIAVPEPSTLALAGAGVALTILCRCRSRRRLDRT